LALMEASLELIIRHPTTTGNLVVVGCRMTWYHGHKPDTRKA
jgi:hypothetical protein